MLFKDALAEPVNLNLPRAGHPCPLKPEVDSADATE
jgi:hypothetical protein